MVFWVVLQVLFDQFGCLKKYNTVIDILKEFFEIRMAKYGERKAFIEGMLDAEAAKLENQARFILEKIDGKVVIGMCKDDIFIKPKIILVSPIRLFLSIQSSLQYEILRISRVSGNRGNLSFRVFYQTLFCCC